MKINTEAFAVGRIIARPGNEMVDKSPSPGLHSLGLDKKRDAIIYIPTGYDAAKPAPLAVMLHGAGGDAAHGI